MKGIKNQLLRGIFAIIFITVILLNLSIMIFVRKYYYDNTEDLLRSRIEVSVDFYKKYFSSKSLVETIYDNVDTFWNQDDAEVQILDSKGNLLMDSIGVRDKNIITTSDVQKAIGGEKARWVGSVDYYKGKVMAVSYPLIVDGQIKGIIRFITSLNSVDGFISNIMYIFISISAAVIIIGIIMSILLANRIINPIKYLNKVAEKMGRGNLSVRSTIENKDEIGQLSNTLNYMADEIHKREQLKNEFISSISHELRTPLTAIKGWAITLNSSETDEETLKLGFDIIEKEADRLSLMVEELLDFSRLINENVNLRLESVNIESFIIHIESFMRPRASEDKIDFNVALDIYEDIYIDSNRLKQVFINLLDNAFKFTDEGGNVSFTITKLNNSIKFVVKDTGCGISQEDLPRVKQKFFKGKNSKSQNGIGLSICDEIIKLHKGTFNIKSTLGVGTEIEVIIPINKEV